VPNKDRIEQMSETKPDNQIDYIELPASDIEKTKKFYSSVFGWKFTDYGPDYTSFHDGRLGGGFTRATTAPGKGTLLVIYSIDLAAVQQKIKAAGGRIVKETFSFPGGRRFHFADPNGNELAVWSE
jgi:predicted enzyme related to lactoylglutathione lyase